MEKYIQKFKESNVGKEIYRQIMAMDKWALGAWGMKNPAVGGREGVIGIDKKPEGYFTFNVRGSKMKSGGKILIALMWDDTYTVVAYRLRGADLSVINKAEGVYFDNLISVIDGFVG